MLVQQELARGNVFVSRQTDMFRTESARSGFLFSTILGGQFRLEMSRGSISQIFDSGIDNQLATPSSVPSTASILQDVAPSADSILKTSW